jgi:NitT/TauT family transport system substrate-binding protein
MGSSPAPTVLRLFAPIVLQSLAGCRTAPPPPPTPITVQLSFTHQAQFAGFYAAEQKGYYAREGLEVTLAEGGPGVSQIDPLLGGSAQFSVLPAEQVVLARADGKPIRAIAAIFRRSPRAYVALAESGIRRPEDFAGKTISVSQGGNSQRVAILHRVGIDADQYARVDPDPDLGQLTSGAVDVRAVWITNEVLTLRSQGYELNVIVPDNYGIHGYADVIATTDETIGTDPDLVLRLARATLEGWTYAVEHPGEAGDLVLKYNPRTGPDFQVQQMAVSLPLVNTGEDFIGWMKPELWAGMERTLREQDLLAAPLDVAQAYTLDFLQQVYAS